MLYRQYPYFVPIAERIDPGLHATAIRSLMTRIRKIVVKTVMSPHQYKVRAIMLYHLKKRSLSSNPLLLSWCLSRSRHRLLYEVIKEHLIPHRF